MAIVFPAYAGQPIDTGNLPQLPPNVVHSCINYIGYKNILPEGSVSYAPNGDPSDCFDWKPFTRWLPSTASGASAPGFHVEYDEPQTVDYLALHDFDGGGTDDTWIQFVYWPDKNGSFIDVFHKKVDPRRPLFEMFEPITGDKFAIFFSNVPPNYQAHCSVMSMGQWLGIPMQDQGWTPPRLARDSKLISSVSESGQFLGRSLVRQASTFDITATFLQIDWAYTAWMDFICHAEKYPFFFHWDIGIAQDTVFCWVDEPIDPPTFAGAFNVDARLKVRGEV